MALIQEVGTATSDSQGERPATRRVRAGRSLIPLALVAPVVVVLALVLGYPLVKLITLSFQDVGLRQLWGGGAAPWVGLDQYSKVLSDSVFWAATERTVILTVVLVVSSLAISMALALLLGRVHPAVRKMITFALLFAWAVPQIVSTQVFAWFADPNFGLFDWLLTKLGFAFKNHDWFVDNKQGFLIVCLVVVWGAIPFLTITLYAGMTMVPKELTEAARVDGARPLQVFRSVTLPVIRPLVVIVTSLSVIWDFQVFNQIYVLRQNKPEPGYYTLGIFLYTRAFGSNSYSYGSAAAVIMILLMGGMMVFYVRQMLQIGDSD